MIQFPFSEDWLGTAFKGPRDACCFFQVSVPLYSALKGRSNAPDGVQIAKTIAALQTSILIRSIPVTAVIIQNFLGKPSAGGASRCWR